MSYFELDDALVVFWGQLWVLEKWVLHIYQVPLLRHVAIQDKRHLGDHWGLQSQFGQRGCGALDGCPVLTIHTALNATQAGHQGQGLAVATGDRQTWRPMWWHGNKIMKYYSSEPKKLSVFLQLEIKTAAFRSSLCQNTETNKKNYVVILILAAFLTQHITR